MFTFRGYILVYPQSVNIPPDVENTVLLTSGYLCVASTTPLGLFCESYLLTLQLVL